jgi:Glycosyltransferase family 87
MRAPGAERRDGPGVSAAWTLLGGLICLAGLLMLLAVTEKAGNRGLYDFRGGLFNAGVAILHGHSPYQPGFLAHQAAIMRAGGIARGETTSTAFSIPVYPAAANLAAVPLSLLPYGLAGALYTAISIAAMVAGIWLLGVRDWRCVLLVLVSWPFIYGLYLGAIGPFLVLGAGIAWRWRDRLWPPAIAIAAIVGAKVFPWPLGIWLLITRRFKALALTVAIGVVLTLGAWAVIGFDGLAQYPQMLSNLSFLQEGRAVSVVSVLLVAGLSPGLASGIALALTGALLAGAWRIARGPDGDRKAFGLVIIAALTSTPIVWEHYMVLLFVPVALASPRLSKAWLLPLCTPLVVVGSSVIIPVSHKLAAHPAETLRSAVPWLLVETLVAARLVLSGHRLPAPRLHPHLRSRSAPAGTADLA